MTSFNSNKIRPLICLTLSLFTIWYAASASANSSFNEVWSVINNENWTPTSDAEKQEMAAYNNKSQLAHYEMNFNTVFKYGESALKQAAHRTLNDKSDYFDRLVKLLHPNGICVAGAWTGTSDAYTGAFAQGRQMPFIGRYSVAMDNTLSDDDRGFGFAGKLFPTGDVNESVATENFFSVDVLMGTSATRILEVATTNEPESGFSLGLLRMGLKIASVLKSEDQNPMFRPINNLGRMLTPQDVSNSVKPNAPKWIRIHLNGQHKLNNEKDFRNEILRALAENGSINLVVDGSNTTSDREAKKGWAPVAQIRLTRAMVSYGCDRRLHFAHPKFE